MDKIKVVLADDHNLFRNGLKLLLSNCENISIVGEACDGKELLSVLGNTKADVVLIDIEMPVMNGIEATRAALERFPDLKIISTPKYPKS
jgi:DNA-binding NarL/FixJ family response regulator